MYINNKLEFVDSKNDFSRLILKNMGDEAEEYFSRLTTNAEDTNDSLNSDIEYKDKQFVEILRLIDMCIERNENKREFELTPIEIIGKIKEFIQNKCLNIEYEPTVEQTEKVIQIAINELL